MMDNQLLVDLVDLVEVALVVLELELELLEIDLVIHSQEQ
jgi:hypothetical protein